MVTAFLITVIARPRRSIALLALILGTRSERITLSDSKSGQVLREYFSRRSLGLFPVNRFCRGVLPLPGDHAEYLRGRRRQALRTNLRHAAKAGIRCELVDDRSYASEDLLSVLDARGDRLDQYAADGWRDMIERTELTLIVARAPTGRATAIAGVLIDDSVALLLFALADDHRARWMLHDHLVQLLIEDRVTYLVAEGGGPFGALGFPPAIQHYQHLLGYELRNLVPKPRRTTRRRGLVACIAILTAAASLLILQIAAGAAAA